MTLPFSAQCKVKSLGCRLKVKSVNTVFMVKQSVLEYHSMTWLDHKNLLKYLLLNVRITLKIKLKYVVKGWADISVG